MISLEEKLKARLKDLKKDNQVEVVQNIEVINEDTLDNKLITLYKKTDLSYIDEICIEEDEDTKNYLKSKTIHLYVQDNLTKLKLGEILEEVAQKIGNKKNGLYLKWLEGTGINSRTALRYRNKFFLFNKINGDNGKRVVLELGHEDIEKILEENSTTERVINILENGGDKSKIKDFLYQISTIEVKEDNKTDEVVNFRERIQSISYEISQKWENIDNKKQKKIAKLFGKIKDILEN